MGRDIEYRELKLRRGEDNVWELAAGGGDQISLEEMQLTTCLSALMASRSEFIGTPTQLSERIDPCGTGGMSEPA